jgi:hypothetical protein
MGSCVTLLTTVPLIVSLDWSLGDWEHAYDAETHNERVDAANTATMCRQST